MRTPYAASDIWMAGIPKRGIPTTYPAPPFDPEDKGLTGPSPSMPVPWSKLIFSSRVISFRTIVARSSGASLVFAQGHLEAAAIWALATDPRMTSRTRVNGSALALGLVDGFMDPSEPIW